MLLFALAILAVTLGLSFGDHNRPQRWIRVWGGPTEGPAPLSLRLELVDTEPLHGSLSQHGRLLVTDDADGRIELPLLFDAEGAAFVHLPARTRRTWVAVELAGKRLASGPIALTREGFWKSRKVRGGWLHGKTEGTLAIAVGCRSGVLALGQRGELAILVKNVSGQPTSVELTLELEGLQSVPSASPVTVRSNRQGQATVEVIPRDLSASVRVLLGHRDTPAASYFSSIPIERSALQAGISEGKLVADSLIPLTKAYFSLVNDQGRWAAGAIELRCDGTGHCHGEMPIETAEASPAWLMLGTEPALDGPNVVGWPVATTTATFVSASVVVKDQLLLDGRVAIMAEAARENAARFSRVVLGMGLAGLLLVLAIALPLVRSSRERRMLASQMPKEQSDALMGRRSVSMVGILLLVILGLFALIFWAKTRLLGG